MTRGEGITALLDAVARKEPHAESVLLRQVYTELKAQAVRQVEELPQAQLDATVVVHEAFLRMLRGEKPTPENRRQFFFVAARAMRDIVVEETRRAMAQKRGGAWQSVELTEDSLIAEGREQMVLHVHEALDRLREQDALCAEVVLLRFFGGRTYDEIAEILSLAKSRVRSEWAFAQEWLAKRLR